jgi:hypothetical protein
MVRQIPNDTAAPSRPDRVAGAVPGQEFVYGLIQTAWSGWARRRYADEFECVATFCLFIGYPRSGHSLVGAMLNAHRHAVISHELDAPKWLLAGCSRDELYSRILGRAAWFNLRGNRSNYEYQIPNRWQGRFEALRVIGDKRGGSAALWLGQHPDLLKRLRATVGVPIRLVHVVRNPFDNIAAIARWHGLSLDQSSDFYFSHCQTTGTLDASADVAEAMTIHHEDLVRSPTSSLSALCAFLGLAPDPEYLAACASIVFDKPTQPRRRTAWSPAQLAEIEQRARQYPFLDRYSFEIGRAPLPASAESPPPNVGVRRRPKSAVLSGIDRLSAFLSPRVSSRESATRGSYRPT